MNWLRKQASDIQITHGQRIWLYFLSAVIMFNINKRNPLFFYVVLGIVVSVLIYYINFMFISLGNTGKIPTDISVFLPIIFISLITLIGLIRINEK